MKGGSGRGFWNPWHGLGAFQHLLVGVECRGFSESWSPHRRNREIEDAAFPGAGAEASVPGLAQPLVTGDVR